MTKSLLGNDDDMTQDYTPESPNKRGLSGVARSVELPDWIACPECGGAKVLRADGALTECGRCEGTGGWVTKDWEVCPTCGGDGDVRDPGSPETCECPDCGGLGGVRAEAVAPPPPTEDDYEHPYVIRKTRTHKGRLYVAGEHLNNGRVDEFGERHHRDTSPIMIVSPAVTEEECGAGRNNSQHTSKTLQRMSVGVLKGPAGTLFKNLLRQSAIQHELCYYTSIVKWNLGSNKLRKKPRAKDFSKAMPTFRNEIDTVKPKIIVCLGKAVFDQLWTGPKFKQKDVEGAYFWEPSLNCHLYLMGHVTEPLYKPQFIAKWLIDLREVRNLFLDVLGCTRPKTPLHYRTLSTLAEVRAWVNERLADNDRLFCIDMESAGRTFTTEKLRSLQVCWKPGHAVFIRFMDENMEYVMDADYKTVGAELNRVFALPESKFIGHQLTVDMVWIYHVLGIEVYKKAAFDTLFAQQVLDEYSDLKLERLAIQYTDLGRYDLELKTWLKTHKRSEDDGFGTVPDDILMPYGMKDVDAPFRIYLQQAKKLKAQGLEDYYYNLHLPFVTDVFTSFSYVGLPVDKERLYYMRDLYTKARDKLTADLRTRIHQEARSLMFGYIIQNTGCPVKASSVFERFETLIRESKQDALTCLREVCTRDAARTEAFVDHYIAAPDFNIRSQPAMRRWLFEVKGHEPLKTTANRDEGIPSISWEKVKRWPPERRKTVTPAVDTSTIKVLAEKDVILKDVLKINLVGNIVKNFLKAPKADGTEDGVFQWICADGRIHGNFSSTETGRPRSWQPNMLNWSKQVAVEIEAALRAAFAEEYWESDDAAESICKVLDEHEWSDIRDALNEGGLHEAVQHLQTIDLPTARPNANINHVLADLQRYAKVTPNVYSLRSCIKAPPGWCFVESDLQTAEIVTLAYISGDRELLAAVTEHDVQFAIDRETGKTYRIAWAPYCRISEGRKRSDLLHDPNDPRWKRDADGNLVHPKRDLHWETIEDRLVMDTPREELIPLHGGRGKEIYRGAGKVGNFQLQYGASGSGIEQSIEAATLNKPEPGLGDKIKESFATRFSVAAEYQESMAQLALDGGNYQSFSGRIRRSFALDKFEAYDLGLSEDEAARSASGLSREFRNFPQQEGVGAHMARGGIWLLEHYLSHGMRARPVICLYDAMLTLCPLEERFEGLKLHKKYLSEVNKWPIEDRILEFGTDDELCYRWSTEPTPAQKMQLYDRNWKT